METLIPAILVAVVTVILLCLRWLRKNDDYFKKRGVPHDPRPNIVTFLYSFSTKTMHDMFFESYRKHGRVYGGYEWRAPVYTVCEPDLLRDILVKDFNKFNTRRDFDTGDPILQNMITILKGEDWKRVRTIITPAFTSKRMRQMSNIMNECSQTIVKTMGKYADQKKPANVKNLFGAFTMDVIASSAFATKINSHDDPNNIFVQMVRKSFADMSLLIILTFFVLPEWLTRMFKISIMPSADFFKNIVSQVVKERRETGKKYDDVLQLLMEAQDEHDREHPKDEDETDQFGSITNNGMIFRQKCKGLSENELVAQCILFFVVGYETTAATLTYMAYCLAINPECQEKLIAEVDAAFEKHKEFNYDVVRDMKYLDCVLSETLRMYPVLTRSERTACEDYKLGNTGITIEKGTLVGFNIQAMHYDPEFFPDPEKFDPERFMEENIRHPQYAYLPFGAGPRNCLGMRFAIMEIKLCMSNILRHYRFRKAETTKVPLEFRKRQGLLMVHDLPLLFERRNK